MHGLNVLLVTLPVLLEEDGDEARPSGIVVGGLFGLALGTGPAWTLASGLHVRASGPWSCLGLAARPQD